MEHEDRIRAFLEQFKFHVGYWDGEELTFYSRRAYSDNSLEPLGIEEFSIGSQTDKAWGELASSLPEDRSIVVALSPDLEQQWQKEFGPAKVHDVIYCAGGCGSCQPRLENTHYGGVQHLFAYVCGQCHLRLCGDDFLEPGHDCKAVDKLESEPGQQEEDKA